MATKSLQVNRDIILASKRQFMKDRKQHIPTEAALAIAQMQARPQPLLNVATDNDSISLIAQVTRTERYDPVMSALHCVYNGASAVSFFTDHSIYQDDFDDVLMVARGLKDKPVVYQNYLLDEYSVMLARGASVSAVVAYASVLSPADLRRVVCMAQRWKMSVFIQVNSADELETAINLSPHALFFGDNLSGNVENTVRELLPIRAQLPTYLRVMLMHTLYSPEEVEIALTAKVDAVLVSDETLKQEKHARMIKSLIKRAEDTQGR